MNTILSLLVILAVSALTTKPATAQVSPKVPRIGLLSLGSFQGHERHRRELLLGLEELGYVQGGNIIIEYRYAEGSRNLMTELAGDLVRLNVSVIVAGGPNAIRPAMKATNTTPIVMVSGGDVVDRGFVKDLTRPGGNVTGLRTGVKGLSLKRMELLKETFPPVSRVAVLNPRERRGTAKAY